jgi:antitoxin (DNA-binding transcriptional repressor) of toxin-antitoxin stability system
MVGYLMEKMLTVQEAASRLSELVQSLQDGSERDFVISVDGEPVARLVPLAPGSRPLGMDEGLGWIGDGFDADNEKIAALFTGERD